MRNDEAAAIAAGEGVAVPGDAVPYEAWARRAAGALTCRPFGSDPTPEPAEAALLAALYPVPGDRSPDAGFPSASWWVHGEKTVLQHPGYGSYPGLLSLLASLYAAAWHRPRASEARLDFAGTGRAPVVIGTLLAREDGPLAGAALAFRASPAPRSLACETAHELACLWATIASQVSPAGAAAEAARTARAVLLAAWHDEDVSVDDYAIAVEGLEPLIPAASP